MDRRPERAWLIAGAAGVGWLALAAFTLFESVDVRRLTRRRALAARAARASSAMGAQSLIQLCLFFSVPFFVRAVSVPVHWVFTAVVIVAAAATLWDPFCTALLRRPATAALLQGIATFAGLDCVLPLLGMSNRVSLLIATLAAVFGVPFAVGGGWRRRVLTVLATSAAVAMAAYTGGARLIPPAPLQFVSGAMGSAIENRELVDAKTIFETSPERMVCATAIAAPRGLRDHLRHVWRQDGARRGEMTLAISGGRAQGYRAWSWKRAPSPGRWTCTVETETGQVLGRVAATVLRLPPAAPPPL
jgi:hypothetical protein